MAALRIQEEYYPSPSHSNAGLAINSQFPCTIDAPRSTATPLNGEFKSQGEAMQSELNRAMQPMPQCVSPAIHVSTKGVASSSARFGPGALPSAPPTRPNSPLPANPSADVSSAPLSTSPCSSESHFSSLDSKPRHHSYSEASVGKKKKSVPIRSLSQPASDMERANQRIVKLDVYRLFLQNPKKLILNTRALLRQFDNPTVANTIAMRRNTMMHSSYSADDAGILPESQIISRLVSKSRSFDGSYGDLYSLANAKQRRNSAAKPRQNLQPRQPKVIPDVLSNIGVDSNEFDNDPYTDTYGAPAVSWKGNSLLIR